jgi:Glutathione S-transferase, N-terminal domain
MTIELYVPPRPRAFKVMAVANHLGVDWTLRPDDLVKGEQKSPEFAALNPNMRMPVLKDGDYVLWESNAIGDVVKPAILANGEPDMVAPEIPAFPRATELLLPCENERACRYVFVLRERGRHIPPRARAEVQVVSRRVLRDGAAPRRRDHGWRWCGRETTRCRSHRRSLVRIGGLSWQVR